MFSALQINLSRARSLSLSLSHLSPIYLHATLNDTTRWWGVRPRQEEEKSKKKKTRGILKLYWLHIHPSPREWGWSWLLFQWCVVTVSSFFSLHLLRDMHDPHTKTNGEHTGTKITHEGEAISNNIYLTSMRDCEDNLNSDSLYQFFCV